MFALAGLEVLEGLVSHFEPCEVDDAEEFIAVFPDLTLSKFKRHVFFTGEESVSPGFAQSRTPGWNRSTSRSFAQPPKTFL